MKHLLVFILSIGLLFVSVTASAQSEMERYLVEIKGPVEQAVENAGGHVIHIFDLIPVIAIIIPKAAVPALEEHPLFVSIIEDPSVSSLKKPPWAGGPGGGEEEQPEEVLEWGVDRIDAKKVWPNLITGSGVNVAIIDTGIDKDHPDLADNIAGGQNFVPRGRKVDPSKWDDDNGHGTHVAGIVAAIDNEVGVIGVSPTVSLYGLKALDRNGSGYLSDVMAALEWSIDNDMNNGMKVVNMSLGTSSDYRLFHDLCDQAATAGLTLVAAAGNNGGGTPLYPAAYSSVIAVGATDDEDKIPSWSNSKPELVAPGVYVRSTWKDGGYETISGTSMACPHVAGTAALVIDSGRAITPTDIRFILGSTADVLANYDIDRQGSGLVDAEQAATGSESSPAPRRPGVSSVSKLSVTWGELKGK